MALTGLPFLVVLIVAAAGLIGATMLLWNRWRWPWAVPIRLVCLLLMMVAGAALAGDLINRDYGFYSSFNDLLGRVPVQGTIVSTAGPSGLDSAQGWHALYRPGHGRGRVVEVRLDGARSGVRRYALVYLPAAYFQPSQARRRFPVIELFHGYPGNPTNWTRQLHFDQTLDAEIAAGRMPPVIAVAPLDNEPGRDSECVDALGGQRDETYLAVDVPTDIQRQFRALDTPRAWATLGYSTGGFCAVNLALHHPHLSIDVHELVEVVTSLSTKRADPQIGQIQVLEFGLLVELIKRALGHEAELADQAARLTGHLGKAFGTEEDQADEQDHEDLANADVEHSPASDRRGRRATGPLPGSTLSIGPPQP